MVVRAEETMFEKPKEMGSHMKPLYIKGRVDGRPVGCMMVDGGTSVNIMPLATFQRLGHCEEELRQTNMSLTSFVGDPVEAKGIISKELTVGSKTISIAFFMVDVKGRYNLLLGHDWIHANRCVPSTLHQCLMQWVGNQIDVIEADGTACVAVADSQEDVQGGKMSCLTGRDQTEYDYVSVGRVGFIPISVKPTMNMTRFTDGMV
jgi:hypothetical protein